MVAENDCEIAICFPVNQKFSIKKNPSSTDSREYLNQYLKGLETSNV